MKTKYFSISAACLALALAFSPAAMAQSKLSISALQKVSAIKHSQTTGNVRYAAAAKTETLPVLIEVVEGTVDSDIDVAGIEVANRIGNIVLASVPAGSLEELAALKCVKSVDLTAEANTEMMHARISTFASKVQGNIDKTCPWTEATRPFDQGYLGRNVVVGLLDNGMDPNHINFFRRPDFTESRVKLIVQFDANGKEVKRWSTPEEIATYTTEDETNPATHGTHVLGIMAGAFNGEGEYVDYDHHEIDSIEGRTNKDPMGCCERIIDHIPSVTGAGSKAPIPYSGMAPESDIVICTGPLNSHTELAAAQAIVDYAKSVDKPAVVNFSLGQNFGSCDGTDNFSKAIAKIGEEAIVCIAAGNDGNKPNWISRTFTADQTSVQTLFQAKKENSLQGAGFEIWGADERPFKVTMLVYNNDKQVEQDEPEKMYELGTLEGEDDKYVDGEIGFAAPCFSGLIQMTGAVMAQNNRYCVKITLPNNLVFDDMDIDPVLGVRIEGVEGQRVDLASNVDLVNLVNLSDSRFEVGTPDMSINNMACAHNVFAVGAYVNRNIYGNLHKKAYALSGTVGTYDHTATWFAKITGYGTLVDGRQMPTITAPGYYVVSSTSTWYNDVLLTDYIDTTDKYNSAEYKGSRYGNNSAVAEFNGKKYYWANMSGTSMATPAFAGICALWLEANPNLKYRDIDEVIKNTAAMPKMKGEGLPYGSKKGSAWDETETVVGEKPATGQNLTGKAYYESTKYRYGYGNVDAYEGLKYILTHSELGGVALPASVDNDNVLVNVTGKTVDVTATGNFSVALVDMTGRSVAHAAGCSNVALDADVAAGVYVVVVKGNGFTRSSKVVIR